MLFLSASIKGGICPAYYSTLHTSVECLRPEVSKCVYNWKLTKPHHQFCPQRWFISITQKFTQMTYPDHPRSLLSSGKGYSKCENALHTHYPSTFIASVASPMGMTEHHLSSLQQDFCRLAFLLPHQMPTYLETQASAFLFLVLPAPKAK